jgi:hypothetical protein
MFAHWESLFVHWRITPVGGGSGQIIFKLVTIKIPVANISPDDDRRATLWETWLEKAIYEQSF